jgi:hypothetical protein
MNMNWQYKILSRLQEGPFFLNEILRENATIQEYGALHKSAAGLARKDLITKTRRRNPPGRPPGASAWIEPGSKQIELARPEYIDIRIPFPQPRIHDEPE